MNIIIRYKKNDRIKRLSNIELVEFDTLLKRLFYWEFGEKKGKSTSLKLITDISVNDHRAKE